MNKCINVYSLGYKEGMNSAKYDYNRNKRNYIKRHNNIKYLSIIYDYGYIDGYNKMMNLLKKNLLNYF